MNNNKILRVNYSFMSKRIVDCSRDVLLFITSFLNQYDVFQFKQVSKEIWKEKLGPRTIIIQSDQQLAGFVLCIDNSFDKRDIAEIKIQNFLPNANFRINFEAILLSLKNLQKLTIFDSKHPGSTFQPVDDDLNIISNLKSLVYLEIGYGFSLSDNGMKKLTNLNLTTLIMGGLHRITNQGISFLSNMKKLQNLDLNYMPCLDNCGLMKVSNLSNLVSLRLSDLDESINITSDAFNFLKDLRNVRILILQQCPQFCDSCVKFLYHLPLVKLEITFNSNITDIGLYQLSISSLKLESLSFRENGSITDYGLKYLLSFSSTLAHLDLCNCIRLSTYGLLLLKPLFLKSISMHSFRIKKSFLRDLFPNTDLV